MDERNFTLYIIHHSHTDVGFTDLQEVVEQNQINFLRRALEILDHAETDRPEWSGFRWVCESYWCVEKFLKAAAASEREALVRRVQEVKIGLSGNYLGLVDLADDEVLRWALNRSQREIEGLGLRMPCAMTADINGYPWGYADALIDAGIASLLSCVHAYRGRPPLDNTQAPFWWEAPSGRRLLVYSGDHYHLGNELGLAQEPSFPYTLHDGLDGTGLSLWERANLRIEAYVRSLWERGHPHSFAQLCVSGRMTDNSPPNPGVAAFIDRYNAENKGSIQLRLVTLETFFDAVGKLGDSLPIYRGDWTDWWVDGVASAPRVVRHAREAGRALDLARRLDPHDAYGTKALREKAAENLIIYAEHTFGAAAAVDKPYLPEVDGQDMRKMLYALRANDAASRACGLIQEKMGQTPLILPWKSMILHGVNPYDAALCDVISVDMESAPFPHFAIIDERTREPVPFQVATQSRGVRVHWLSALEKGEHRRYAVEPRPGPSLSSVEPTLETGSEGVRDLFRTGERMGADDLFVSPWRIATPFLEIGLQTPEGIVSIVDRKSGTSLLRTGAVYGAFTPIYEVTDGRGDPCGVRRAMGRGRKAMGTHRYQGRLRQATVQEEGELYASVRLAYEIQGMDLCEILLTVYRHLPRLDVDFQCHKDSVWDPESVYLALPFTAGHSDEVCWLDKAGAPVRPRIDQIPGTNTDFYAVRAGMCYVGPDCSVVIATPDTPLIAMGELMAHPIRLSGDPGIHNLDPACAWIMNTAWDANFRAETGGFHHYRFHLLLSAHREASAALELARRTNRPPLAFVSYHG